MKHIIIRNGTQVTVIDNRLMYQWKKIFVDKFISEVFGRAFRKAIRDQPLEYKSVAFEDIEGMLYDFK